MLMKYMRLKFYMGLANDDNIYKKYSVQFDH